MRVQQIVWLLGAVYYFWIDLLNKYRKLKNILISHFMIVTKERHVNQSKERSIRPTKEMFNFYYNACRSKFVNILSRQYSSLSILNIRFFLNMPSPYAIIEENRKNLLPICFYLTLDQNNCLSNRHVSLFPHK